MGAHWFGGGHDVQGGANAVLIEKPWASEWAAGQSERRFEAAAQKTNKMGELCSLTGAACALAFSAGRCGR
jgi:hypothetical protein